MSNNSYHSPAFVAGFNSVYKTAQDGQLKGTIIDRAQRREALNKLFMILGGVGGGVMGAGVGSMASRVFSPKSRALSGAVLGGLAGTGIGAGAGRLEGAIWNSVADRMQR